MYKTPFFTGIEKGIFDSLENQTVDRLLERSGLNTGNFLFVSALRNILQPSDAPDNVFDSAVHDYVAISAANWVNPSNDLGDIADFIESTKVPVLVVGLGAQVEFGKQLPKLKRGTERFLDVIKERSNSISVRGEHTAEVLSDYGVHNTVATGCPSIVGARIGYSPKILLDKGKRVDRLVLQGTRHGFGDISHRTGKFGQINKELYRYALSNGHHLLLQSEIADIHVAMGRLNNEEKNIKIRAVIEEVYSSGFDVVQQFLKNNGMVFWNTDSWFSKLSEFDFLVGTRIHGVVSGLLAGVPGVLLIHDQRTKELAEMMNIPHYDIRKIDSITPDFIVDLRENVCDLSGFVSGYDEYLSRFRDFFIQNNVHTNLF
jgi:hypothetical protein